MLSGNDPAIPQPTPRQFGQALIDFASNGERWNASLFRGYLKRAIPAAPAEPIRAPSNGAHRKTAALGGARNDAAIDAWLAEKERQRAELEKAELVETQPEEITHGE